MRRDMLEHAVVKLRDLQRRIDQHETKLRFDLDYWWDEDPDDDGSCGTAGCFIGWAAHEKWFDAFGLKLDLVRTMETKSNFVPRINTEPFRHLYAGCRLLSEVFSLERLETIEQIILAENYDHTDRALGATPDDVADRIEELLSLGETEFLEERGALR